MTDKWLEQIDLYHRNQLSEQQKQSLLAQIDKQPELKEEFELRRLEHLAMEMAIEEDLRTKMTDWKKNDLGISSGSSAPSPTSGWRQGLWIAASLAILIAAALWLWPSIGPKGLYDNYYTQDPGLPTVMGTDDHYDFYRGMVDYKAGHYQAALDRWNQIDDHTLELGALNYYQAMCHMGLDNWTAARPLLEHVANLNSSQFTSDAFYYLGLINLKEKNEERAIQYLTKSQHDKAKQLLSKLKQP